ncbi:Ergothioneine biosynthesis protein 1 [Penicillium diatomitis]|uniref:Ergothioneine biosynthesis protein 1 n=1 Tax=Penicillium diatomitis TaxID=2819901 RepID=A0A9W9XDK5_9EURO|nr:Ergothioneine biosynthesis protein 1 [Penicillium diatomitis]KAJ5488782.1 Ergothioneine biosynthesis protein 1 [Penicillium diatomitis]
MSPSALRNMDKVEIVNIQQEKMDVSLVDILNKALNPSDGTSRSFPTLLLYDTRGLKIFEKITYVEDYYLTNAEIEILTSQAKRIVERIPENAQLLELGSGNLRKIEILLRECERVEKHVDYYALDLSLVELKRTFSEISPRRLSDPKNRERPTVVLSMGSSLGNFNRAAAASFLRGFSKALSPSDMLLIGLDACKTPEKVYKAYNDSQGVTREFYENGLVHANAVLRFEAFKAEEWEIITEYDQKNGCHQAFYSPKVDVTINGAHIPKGDRLLFEEAYKYSPDEREELCRNAHLISQVVYANATDDYHIHLLSPCSVEIPLRSSEYASHPVPTLKDFETLWAVWDTVTKTMVPREELLSKPIQLRNALIFYLGHIPTFLDIHLTRALRGNLTEPQSYKDIFERGIDPDVEDPEKCHSHSPIPDEWPRLSEILDYTDRVRSRVRSVLQDGQGSNDRTLGEALWIGYEHEAMHLETFLYMLLQSERVQPPTGVKTPDFASLAQHARENEKPNQWFSIPKQAVTIGLNDVDEDSVPRESFGWDNEKPQRVVEVDAFEAQARPVTNREFAKYLQVHHSRAIPASWKLVHADREFAITNGVDESGSRATDDFMSNFAVRTVFGPVLLSLAQDWPVMASYDELASYAEWAGCRIPTFEEVRSIYMHASKVQAEAKNEEANHHSDGPTNKTTATNGAVSGVKRTANGEVKQSLCAETPVYRSLEDCNVGFQNWHPLPVTPNGDKLAGQGDLGGVWEWTSTPLAPHEGFKAMDIYPGYTSDFFDGKHNIIQGGSWATMPRIAGRSTFMNWYQHNYPYTWAGARLVRDLSS